MNLHLPVHRCCSFLVFISTFLSLTWGQSVEELGFRERFALASDRSVALQELVPGTEEFYFYSALLAQQEERLGDVAGILEPWIKRHGESQRVNEIRHRQALLEYSEDPERTLAYLKKHLGLQFNHQQRKLNAKPDFPTKLSPDLISWDAFLARSIQANSLSQVGDLGLDRLIREEQVLNTAQRRELLQRLVYPDYERLVGLIAADLRTKESRGFGEFGIHRRLTDAQLDELLGLRPEVAKNSAFVDAKLIRLRPNHDVSLDREQQEKDAYLTRLWEYVKTLDPAFNSLKASVLYQSLELDRARGDFSQARFLEYLRLPRPMPYMEPRYLREQVLKGQGADLSVDFTPTTGFAPIRNDEALVRSYLEHFFIEDETINRYSPYIRESYLKEVLAETKLLQGIGDPEAWYSMLTPGKIQSLKERVEISFLPTNPNQFEVEEGVSLSVRLKNVQELLVKVYEVNALNYYLDQKREINTDLNLDGLVANEEKLYRYDDTPIRRRIEAFSFESMTGKRGVWVVEFIGNGISSRALVRKGKLQYLSVASPGGELIQVLDEKNKVVEKPSIWFGGKQYNADENGFVLLPFSSAGESSVVLSDGGFSSFAKVTLPKEEYRLDAGIFLEQETLLTGQEASVVIRPQLSLGGEPVSTSLLEEVQLRVATTDLDGVESVSESKDFALFDNQESIHRFRVPSRLGAVQVTLSAKIPLVSTPGAKKSLRSVRNFDVNGIDRQRRVSDLYLSRFGERWVLEVLGKSGEPIPERSVTISLRHAEFIREHSVSLKTDAVGRVELGAMDGIESLTARVDGVGERRWKLGGDRNSLPDSLHGTVGATVVIPLPDAGEALERNEMALFEMRADVPVRELFEKAKLTSGAVEISGLEAGDYQVYLRKSNRVLELRITDSANKTFGYVLSRNRHLQLEEQAPMHISSVVEKGGKIEIAVANPDDLTRVHLIATRFLPQLSPFHGFSGSSLPPLFSVSRGTNHSLYVSGRDIGEEYRYILERRSSKHYPGNMLPRPGLILNPWALNETRTSVDDAEKGEDYKKSQDMKEAQKRRAVRPEPGALHDSAVGQMSSAYHFLAQQAVVLANLELDEQGRVSVEVEDLIDRQHVHVVAVNGTHTAYRRLALPEIEGGTRFRDLRLSNTLDREKTFTQQRNVTLLKEDQTLSIEDLRAAELETYGTIAEAYGTLSAINQDENFLKFAFISQWPDLEEDKKRELYSEFACHELNFFLSEKDPQFFAEAVQPYLQNKKDKTFLDDYLIGSPLDRYLAPWEFSRLNIVERILLARRLGEGEQKQTADHVRHLLELIPPDPEQSARVFRQALRGRRSDGNNILAESMDALDAPFGGGGAGGGGAVALRRNRAGAAAADPFAAPAEVEAVMAKPVAPQAVAADGFGFVATRGVKMAGKGISGKELQERAAGQILYRNLETTQEWAENNYYHLPIEAQVGELITVNAFWEDFADWNGEGGFYSREFPAASRNFSEMMFVLSVLDLPFAAEEHEFTVEDNALQFTAKSPVVIFHEEIQEAVRSEEETPILVSQNFFRADDRYRYVNGQQVDKFVSDEFLTGVVYGSQIVATNPTSSAHTLELLVQIPEGAIPVSKSDYTKSYPMTLMGFSTERVEVEFYFPRASGENPFAVYPVQVAKNEEVIASGDSASFPVVDELTKFDEASWDYLSQFGSEKEVLDFLAANNLHRINLGAIAWRARENVDFFRKVIALIGSRHAFDQTLWSYGLHHNVLPAAREYLKHREDFLQQCGRSIECELVSLDPVERHWYQHLEYSPLVNARTHRLGRARTVLNDRFRAQYDSFLEVLSYKPKMDAEERLAVTGYLFLQDRIGEGLDWHESIPADELSSRLQYDYLTAYASLYLDESEKAKQIAAGYLDHPIERWRERFATVVSQVEEMGGRKGGPVDEESREEQMEKQTASDPVFQLSATGREAKIVYRNLARVTVNFYAMDLEFLFSSKPFVSGESGQFSYIRPNLTQVMDLPAEGDTFPFVVPDEFASKNVLVEVVGAGKAESVAVYSNQLKIQLSDNYGRLEVRHEDNDKPIARTYVKVYAKMKGGEIRFFKDGYTDLRGKFDYVSLNTDELDSVERLSLLVMSEQNGSLVREVDPPQR